MRLRRTSTLKRRALCAIITLISAGAATGARSEAPAGSSDSDALKATARKINEFGISLYREAGKGNVVVSPASIAVALAMTWAGTRGATADEIGSALCRKCAPADHHAALGSLITGWNATGQVQMANRLFADRAEILVPGFVDFTMRIYGAPVEAMDFRGKAEASRQKINDWVLQQTASRIRDLLPETAVTSGTKLVLANAAAFRADWLRAFSQSETQSQPFFVTRKDSHPVAMMRQQGRFRIARQHDLQALELDYAGQQLSLVVLLPRPGHDLQAIERGLTAASAERLLASLALAEVQVFLPRFRLAPTTSLPLKAVLSRLGIKRMFGPKADFSAAMEPAAGREPLSVKEVYFNGSVEVDEKGTVATAATAVVAGRGGRSEPLEFRADHPFLFFIRDARAGTMLFLGRVADPPPP